MPETRASFAELLPLSSPPASGTGAICGLIEVATRAPAGSSLPISLHPTPFAAEARVKMIGKICLAALLGFGTGSAAAQSPPTPAADAPAKRLTFEVVSIRANQSTPEGSPRSPGPTPDGYHMSDASLLIPMLTAYVPQSGAAFFSEGQVRGLPDWFIKDKYTINAKVADADLTEWQKPASQAAMLPQMLQAMLADRCKMLMHREMKDVSVYLLEVGKGGPKFKETNPSDNHPEGTKLPGGGVLVNSANGLHLYGMSMQSLASLLSSIGGNAAGRPIQDKTDLTGRYDLTLRRPDSITPPPTSESAGGAVQDPGSVVVLSIVEDLGLKVVSSKAPVETLVIDHIEKPTTN